MIQLNPQYEAIFDARNIDEDCNKIADEISDVARMQIKEILAVGIYKQAVTLYLQLLQSMVNHFVEDEHFCYFDDMYSPDIPCNGCMRTLCNTILTRNQENFLKKAMRKSCRANAMRIMAIRHTSATNITYRGDF